MLDETSKDLDDLKGGFGYSLRGTTCTVQDTFLSHKRLRVSALVLHTLDGGFVDWAFTPNTFTKDYFLHVTTENFVDWRGRLRRPMLTDHIDLRRKRCITILLDNASIHHCHEWVRRLTAMFPGVVVRYLPPYCHHLSTLDNGAFGALVQWLERNHDYTQKEALETAFHELNADGGRLARSCFKRCEYL